MSVSLTCKGCKSALKVRDELAGKKVKCPRCATVLLVPAKKEEFAPVEVMPEERIRESPKGRKSAPTRRDDDEEDDDDRTRDDDRRSRVRGDRDREDRRSHVREEDERDRSRRRSRRPRDEEEEEEDDRGRGGKKAFKPCPRCGSGGAKRVLWTAWGSFYGPAMFNHVRCPECGYKYNGRSGRSNMIPAIIFVAVPLIGILGILGGILYMLISRNYIKF